MSKFSKQHYELFACLLREYKYSIRMFNLYSLIEDIIRLFKEDNPRFDETRFRDAILGSEDLQ